MPYHLQEDAQSFTWYEKSFNLRLYISSSGDQIRLEVSSPQRFELTGRYVFLEEIPEAEIQDRFRGLGTLASMRGLAGLSFPTMWRKVA